jgi:hypothetical protein
MEATQKDEVSIKELILKLKEWWRYLLAKWLIILICGITGGVIGIMYAYSKKPVYTAELSFVVEDGQSGGGLGAYSGLASMVGIELGGSSGGIFVGDNLMEFMKSRAMIERTLLTKVRIDGKDQTLAEYYIKINKLREGWESEPKLKNLSFSSADNREQFSREKDSILLGFYDDIINTNLSVTKKDKKLSIISVIVETGNEQFSKAFSETLVKVVSDFYIETKTKKSADNLAILQRQTDSVRYELNAAIGNVAASGDVNPNPNPTRQVLRVPSQRRLIDVQANSAILQELVKNLEIAKISLRKETPLIQIIDRPLFPLNKETFGKRKAGLIGGIIGGLIIVFILIAKELIKRILR